MIERTIESSNVGHCVKKIQVAYLIPPSVYTISKVSTYDVIDNKE
jgi:hypothetical protein